MWTIDSNKIYSLRTPAGDRFTNFVDALIRAEAYIQGVKLSEISTNPRTNLADGGVDTKVLQSMPHSDTGWLSVPTCWQYKATEYRKIEDKKLREEINGKSKEYTRELIKKGYGYRFCICDYLPDKKKMKLPR